MEVLTTTLTDLGGGKTQVVYHQTGHLPEQEYAKIEQRVHGFHDRLAEHLQRVP